MIYFFSATLHAGLHAWWLLRTILISAQNAVPRHQLVHHCIFLKSIVDGDITRMRFSVLHGLNGSHFAELLSLTFYWRRMASSVWYIDIGILPNSPLHGRRRYAQGRFSEIFECRCNLSQQGAGHAGYFTPHLCAEDAISLQLQCYT